MIGPSGDGLRTRARRAIAQRMFTSIVMRKQIIGHGLLPGGREGVMHNILLFLDNPGHCSILLLRENFRLQHSSPYKLFCCNKVKKSNEIQ